MRILTLVLALVASGAAFAKPAPTWAPPDALIGTYNEGVEALNAGNPVEAQKIARKVLAKAPDCGAGLLLLGLARNRANEPEAALEPLQRAVALYPDQAEARAALSEAAFGAQQFPLAESEGWTAAGLAPRDVHIVGFAVQASIRLGNVEGARAGLGRSQLGEADRACLETTILLEERQDAAAKALAAACDDRADPMLAELVRAAFVMREGDSSARRDAVSTLGLSGYELVLKGEELGRAGRWEEAVPVLKAALVAVPNEISARVNLAIALDALGRYAEAELALAEAVASDTWVDMHATGGITGITTKRSEDELRALQREAAVLLVRVQAKNARTGQAAKSLEAARARFGDVLELVVAEAELREAEGKPAEAWTLLRRAAARGQANAALARAIGRLAVDHPDGIDDATAGYVRTHGTPIDRLNLAIGESNGRQYAACLADIEAVLAKDAAAPRAHAIGYACAVQAEELDRAAPLLAQLGTAADRRVVHDHALSLQEQGKHADALALLALYPTDGEMEGPMRALAIRSHLAEKRWAEASALAAKPGLEPMFLAWVGQELLQAERKNDAARVLGDACPKLSGADAKSCRDMLEYAAR